MNDFEIWRRILADVPRGQKVLAALVHIAGVEESFRHGYCPGRRARFLTFAQVQDDS